MRDFEQFMDLFAKIRDDLFFGHDLCVMMDVNDVDVNNWDMIFEKLRDVRADVFGLFMGEDTTIFESPIELRSFSSVPFSKYILKL